MKRIYSILLLLAFAWGAQAQQFAGPNKHVVREVDNSQQTTIGLPDGSADVCYIWTAEYSGHIVGSANLPVITVNPTHEAEYFDVKRISKNGVEDDRVWVYVEDSVEIRSVTAKYSCYSHEENITVSQFEITTFPEGYEHLVTVSPSVALASGGLFTASGEIELTFTLMKDGHRSVKKLNVKVINPDLTVIQNLSGVIENWKTNLENMNKAKEVLDKVKTITDQMKVLKNVPGTPCSWSTNPHDQASEGLDITPKKLCCRDHTESWALRVQFGQLTFGAQFNCRFPFYGVPFVGTVDVVFNFIPSVAVGPVDAIFALNLECAQLCIPITASVTANGGVGVALGGKLLTADLLVQGFGMAQTSWCPIGASNNFRLQGKFSIVGQVTLASGVSYTIEKPFASFSKTIEL